MAALEDGAVGHATKRRRPDAEDAAETSAAPAAVGHDSAAVLLLRSLGVPASSLAMPSIGDAPLVIAFNGSVCLLWNPADCARVRSLGRLCASPVGLCPAKVATRGKAAAVPIVLNDEELYVATQVATHWRAQIVDTRTGRPADARAILAANAARDASGMPHVRRRVFADLWRRGYRCTNGLKFGCDWLSYTADASQVHAAFMVIVRRERRATAAVAGKAGAEGEGEGEGDIAPLDLVAKSRVATAALKICVMAYASAEPDADVDADAATTGAGAAAAATGAGGSSAAAGDGGVDRSVVRYAAFKRMGPGSAVFQSASALLARSAKAAAAAAAASTAASGSDGANAAQALVGAAGTDSGAGAGAAVGEDDDEALEGLSFLPIGVAFGGDA